MKYEQKVSTKYTQKLLDNVKNSSLMHLKLRKKEQFKNTAEATDDFAGKKLLIKSQTSREVCQRTVWKQAKNKAGNIRLNTKMTSKKTYFSRDR